MSVALLGMLCLPDHILGYRLLKVVKDLILISSLLLRDATHKRGDSAPLIKLTRQVKRLVEYIRSIRFRWWDYVLIEAIIRSHIISIYVTCRLLIRVMGV
jgi:hypothetical protein